jgi:hypothetical protein
MEIPQKNYNHVPENRPGYHHIMEQHGTDFVDFARSANRRRLEGQLIFRSVANNRHVAVLSSLPRVSSQSIQDISLRSFLEETGTTLDDWGGDVSEYIDPQ